MKVVWIAVIAAALANTPSAFAQGTMTHKMMHGEMMHGEMMHGEMMHP